MRKILMFGTMLGVASAAFAFGGMFSHGSKSTTYKGGVSAIGVHFGGEKSTDSKEDATESCATGILKDRFGHCNICENGNVYFSYMDDPCGTEIEITGCKTNNDCAANEEYCQIERSGYNGTSTLYTGTCQPLGTVESLFYNEQEFWVNLNDYISYFSAENWCHAQNKRLANFNDLGLDKNTYCDDATWTEIKSVFNTNIWLWVENIAGSWDTTNFSSYSAYVLARNSSEEPWWKFTTVNAGPSGGAICK